MKYFFFLIAIQSLISAQVQWQKGIGTADGTDIEAIRMRALNNARADALAKTGITITARDARLVTESGNNIIDFYSKFAESSTKGIILEERIIREGDLIKIKGFTYQIEIEIEAKVAMQQGEPDPTFSVKLESSKQIVKEGEPLSLTVTTTKAGYLTIFNIYKDSLSVIYPNSIDRENEIDANKTFVFPPHNAYELQLSLPEGKGTSSEIFIAVVTKENIPFPNLEQVKFINNAIGLRMDQLNMYAQWLFNISLNKRSTDQLLMSVRKEIK